MRDAVGLERVEALEVKQRLDETVASWIALRDRHDVGTESITERGIRLEHLVKHLVQKPGVDGGMLQPARQTMADGIFETVMAEHGRVNETAKRRLGSADLVRLAPNLAPDRIVARDRGLLRLLGLLHRNTSHTSQWAARLFVP
jgi:hypothetical protein